LSGGPSLVSPILMILGTFSAWFADMVTRREVGNVTSFCNHECIE